MNFVLTLGANHAARGEACVSIKKSRDKSSFEREEKLGSYNAAARLKNRRSRIDTVLEHDMVSYRRRMPVVLTAPHRTTIICVSKTSNYKIYHMSTDISAKAMLFN